MRLGRPSKPLEHYPDQLRFTPLTADPTSTVQGEAWLRSDLAPEDGQIATIRFDAGSSTWDIPVFETGTAIDTVEEVLRITVNGQLGYIPVAPENESAFSQLGFYHSSQRYGFHDRVEPGSAIPDSVVLQPEPNDLDHFSGDTGDFAIQDITNFGDGDFTLKGTDADSVSTIFSDSGLDAYPEPGQRLSCKIQLPDDASLALVGFGSQDADNGYAVGISGDDRFEIRKDFGQEVVENPTIKTDTVYFINWFWRSESPRIEAELYEGEDADPSEDSPIETIQFDDSEYTDGGVAIRNWRNDSDFTPDSFFADYFIMERL